MAGILLILIVIFVTGIAMASDIFTVLEEGDASKVKEMLGNNPYLVDAYGFELTTPLHFAPTKEIAELLIKKGADVNAYDMYKNTPLHYAASRGPKELVEFLIARGANVNAKSDEGTTPLMKAAIYGDKYIVKILIASGADINVADHEGRTALMAAFGREDIDIDMIKILIASGADINITFTEEPSNSVKYNLLHEACMLGNKELSLLFIDKGLALNSSDFPPLFLAAEYGHKELTDFLIERGASINSVTPGGYNLLHAACKGGLTELISLLIDKGLDVNSVDEEGNTPLYYAVTSYTSYDVPAARKALASMLINKGADVSLSPHLLGEASMRGFTDLVRAIIDKGVDVNSLNESLRYAVGVDLGGDEESLIILIQNGAEITLIPDLFPWALKNGFTNIALAIIKNKGFNVNSVDEEGNTPLHYASSAGNKEVSELLISKGANVNCSDNKGKTPLIKAIENNHSGLAEFLLSLGADINNEHLVYQATRWSSLETLKFLSSKGIKFNVSNNQGLTPLHEAVKGNKIDIVNYLLDTGVSINTVDNKGNTPLGLATDKDMVKLLFSRGATMDNNALHLALKFDIKEIALKLIAGGADINLSDNDRGWYPLHYAAWTGNKEVAELLISKGAQIDYPSQKDWKSSSIMIFKGATPLYLASYQGHREIAELLLDKGSSMDLADKEGNTPLFVSIVHYCDLYSHEFRGNEHHIIAKMLIEKGSDLSIKDKYGNSALHFAAPRNPLYILEMLLKKGIDVNTTDIQGQTPLHKIAELDGSKKNALFLIEKGADINAKNNAGETPLSIASEEIAKLLLARGAKE